jgi:hypothetical protein
MFIALVQVLFATIRTVTRSAVNITLFSLLSRIFNTWLGFNTIVSFFCSAYCLSKIVAYFRRLWWTARLNNKKADERLVADELTWLTTSTKTLRSVNRIDA